MGETLKVRELEAERITVRRAGGAGPRIEMWAGDDTAALIIAGRAGDGPNVEIACSAKRIGVTLMDADPTDPLGARVGRIRAEMEVDRFGTARVVVYGADGEPRALEAGCACTAARTRATDATAEAEEALPLAADLAAARARPAE